MFAQLVGVATAWARQDESMTQALRSHHNRPGNRHRHGAESAGPRPRIALRTSQRANTKARVIAERIITDTVYLAA
jgi:hypothetical protein